MGRETVQTHSQTRTRFRDPAQTTVVSSKMCSKIILLQKKPAPDALNVTFTLYVVSSKILYLNILYNLLHTTTGIVYGAGPGPGIESKAKVFCPTSYYLLQTVKKPAPDAGNELF